VDNETAQRGRKTVFEALLQQTDLDAEAAACRKFGEACQHIDGVVVPQPVAVVDECMLILEYFDGVSLHELPTASPHRHAYAQSLIKAIFIPILLHGLVHADLHAGNVLFRESDGTVGIIDFGLVYIANKEAMDGMMAAMPDMLSDDEDPTLFDILATLCVGGVLEPRDVVNNLNTKQHSALVTAVANMLKDASEASDFGMVSTTTRFMPELRTLPGCEKLNCAPYGIQLWQAASAVRALAVGLGGSRAGLIILVDSTLRRLVHLDLLSDNNT
jgi:serine/threonine protein kinase